MRRDVEGTKLKTVDEKPADPVEGIVLVDLGFRSVAIDEGGRTILHELSEHKEPDSPLPALPPQIEQPLRAMSPAELNSTTLRIRADESHFTCEVFLLQPHNGALTEPLLALYIRRNRAVSEAVERASRFYRLTEREQETLFGIASGLTSRQIAEKMKISPNTVNAFLRLVMVKMGVTTRAGIVGKLVNGRAAEVEMPPGRSQLPAQPPRGSVKGGAASDWDF